MLYGSAHTSVRPVRAASARAWNAYATLPTRMQIAAAGSTLP